MNVALDCLEVLTAQISFHTNFFIPLIIIGTLYARDVLVEYHQAGVPFC